MWERVGSRKGGQIKREIRTTERKNSENHGAKEKIYEKGKY